MSETSQLIKLGRGSYYDKNIHIMSWKDEFQLIVGRYCSIGRDCMFFLNANHRPDWVTTSTLIRGLVTPELNEYLNTIGHNSGKGDIIIGNDVWIGADCKIMSGVHIGDGAVVAAGSVVSKNVKPYTVVGGNPAEFLYTRFRADLVKKLLEIRWWDWPEEKVQEYSDLLWSSKIEEFIKKAQTDKQSIKKINIVKTEDNNKVIKYKNNTSSPLDVNVEFVESYTNLVQYSDNLLLNPDVEYWSSQSHNWNNRLFRITDSITNEIYAEVTLSGVYDIQPMDRHEYLKNIANKITDHQLRLGLIGVIGEHLAVKQNASYVDVEPGDTVVDIGFNFGIFSIRALNAGAAKIIAFEPNKELYKLVDELYPDRDKVTIHNVAVSDYYGETTFYSTAGSLDSSTLIKPMSDFKIEEYQVPVIDFFDFIQKEGIDHIDLLKIDCEGEEYKIIKSIPDHFFTKISKIILEYHFNSGPEAKEITDKLDRNGFEYIIEVLNDTNSLGMIYAKKN